MSRRRKPAPGQEVFSFDPYEVQDAQCSCSCPCGVQLMGDEKTICAYCEMGIHKEADNANA